MSGYFESLGLYVTQESAYTATILTIWEAIVSFLFSIFIFNNAGMKDESSLDGDFLSGNKSVYILFVLFAVALFIASGANHFKFFLINLSDERLSASADSNSSVGSAIIEFGLIFLVSPE